MRILCVTILLLTIGIIPPSHVIAETQNSRIIQPSVKTRDRANKAMNNLLHGPIGPYQATSSIKDCGEKNKNSSQEKSSCSGKEIASVISGAWQLATFWYPDTDDHDKNAKK